MKTFWKTLSTLLIGMIAGMFLSPKKENTNNVAGDYIEKNKETDNSKIKIKKGMFGFLKRDPEKKKAAKLRRENKKKAQKEKRDEKKFNKTLKKSIK